jgi:hypothetical protein
LNRITKRAYRLATLTGLAVVGGLALQAQTAQPGTIYSTYLGGSNRDVGRSVAVDAMGNAFVVGETFSSDFPIWPPGHTPIPGPLFAGDGFLTKFTPDGRRVDSAYFGSGLYDSVNGVAVSPNGAAYVVGTAFNLYESSEARAFVTRIGPGPGIVYSKFFGGQYARGYASPSMPQATPT